MTTDAEPIEDIAAAMLNGVMVFLGGAALPTFLIWAVATGPRDWILTPDFGSPAEAGQGATLVVASIFLMRWGARTIWRSVDALRKRGSSAG